MIYDAINTICVANGITVWKIERDLGFSNGCIRKWNESDPGIRKVQKVAEYLHVPLESLLNEEGEGSTHAKT